MHPDEIQDDDLLGLVEWLMVYDGEHGDPKVSDRTWKRLIEGIVALRAELTTIERRFNEAKVDLAESERQQADLYRQMEDLS